MTPLRSLSARNPRAAQLWAATALLAAGLTSLVVQALASPDGTSAGAVGTFVVVVLAAPVLVRLPAERVAPWVVLAPLLGVAAIVTLDLGSGDAGITGIVFFILPVVFAAAHLRAVGVVVVCAATSAGVAVVVFTLLPRGLATVDATYVTVVLLLVSAVLGRSAAQNERALHRLRLLADLDPLTGLATRRVLDTATAGLARAQRGSGGTGRGALLLVDLDRFKAVNDTHGHLGGDAALTHVAALLRSACRGDDLAARMGGDELAVLLVGCTPEDATRRAHDVVDLVRTTPLVLSDGTRVPLSVSVGVAPVHVLSRTSEDLYARADGALYAAKRAGRDRAVTASA